MDWDSDYTSGMEQKLLAIYSAVSTGASALSSFASGLSIKAVRIQHQTENVKLLT